jgi:predicted DCC family thiol-disulfide oxidoreductase YuxK
MDTTRPPDAIDLPAGCRAVVLFDGVCGLCDRFIHFLAARDRTGRICFAPLQGHYARQVLGAHGLDAAAIDSVGLHQPELTPPRDLLLRARAALHALKLLGGGWTALALILGTLPTPLLDWGYGNIARRRYRLFGKYEQCPRPTPELRERYIEL